MEKTTKKSRKKSKRLKKRIGIIAVGGLSFVLTICLSVGATLAWFAGSTWASKDVYMGGPVYVEMTGSNNDWKAGSGMLDIKADTSRTTGTVQAGYTNDVLLPGQKIQISSKARVYSTNETDSRADGAYDNLSSGANTSNTSTNNGKYNDMRGRITTTTSSVLRARFSINVEFDPSVGFNNFTSEDYMKGYPVQSSAYTGDGDAADETWEGALTTSGEFKTEVKGLKADGTTFTDVEDEIDSYGFKHTGRRDYVPAFEDGVTTTDTGKKLIWTASRLATDTIDLNVDGTADKYKNAANQDVADTALRQIQLGGVKSIYKWRYCSKTEYDKAKAHYGADFFAKEKEDQDALLNAFDATTGASKGLKILPMGAPFDGTDKSKNANGYYGVWVLEDYDTGVETATGSGKTKHAVRFSESSGFYKARTNAYLQTYVEYYENEYGNVVERTISSSLTGLDNALNNYFKTLINDSSDEIIARELGVSAAPVYEIDSSTGKIKMVDGKPVLASGAYKDKVATLTGNEEFPTWLYIDPSIGNDTNTDEISTSTGGWWYLVSSDYHTISAGNSINIVKDSVTDVDGADGTSLNQTNTPGTPATGDKTFTRSMLPEDSDDPDYRSIGKDRLFAKLYEIKPTLVDDDDKVGIKNGEHDIKKVTSKMFPFVNGTFALPGDALTNVFANAKISFQISFQAIQAFFPYTNEIDGVTYENNLFGTAKALNIANAIPIFNEAFDYSETGDGANTEIPL